VAQRLEIGAGIIIRRDPVNLKRGGRFGSQRDSQISISGAISFSNGRYYTTEYLHDITACQA